MESAVSPSLPEGGSAPPLVLLPAATLEGTATTPSAFPEVPRGRWLWLRGPLADTVVLAILLGLTLAFYRALLVTGEVAADPLLMRVVYPSRQFLAEALREGRLALWNPYLFTGVPFLADPGTGALYPPNLTLRWLDPPRQVALSLLVHTLLAAAGTYTLARRVLAAGRPAAMTGAGVFAFGGFLGANAVEPAVVEAAAWLPWALWVSAWAYRRRLIPGVTASAVVLALQVLAGALHIAVLTMLGCLALVAVCGAGDALRPAQGGGWIARRVVPLVRAGCVAALAPALAVLLAAPQLFPSWELYGRSAWRIGIGGTAQPAPVLPPEQVVRALLPSFTENPERMVLAHVGVVTLGLVLVGLRRLWRGTVFGVLLTMLGLVLALGETNPLRQALYRIAPPWAVFDRPAQALLLVAMGVAMLAATGLDRLDRGAPVGPSAPMTGGRRWIARAVAATVIAVLFGLLLPWVQRVELPSRGVIQIWIGLGIIAIDVALLLPLLRPRRWIAALLVAGVMVELLIAGARLPFARTADRAAFDVAPALAAVIADERMPPRVARIAGVGEQDVIPDRGFDRYIAARAGRDRLAPNTAMRDHVATLEGLPSTLLPTREVVAALQQPERRLAVGSGVPEPVGALSGDPLGLLGPRLGATHVIGPPRPPIRSGMAEFVLGLSLEVPPGETVRIELGQDPVATGVALLTDLVGGAPLDGQAVAELTAMTKEGDVRRRTLLEGVDIARAGAAPAGRAVTLGDGRTATVTEQPLGRAGRFQSITLRNLTPGVLRLHALSLLDERTGSATPVPLNEVLRPVAGTEPTVYVDLRALPRVALVRLYTVNPDIEATLRALPLLPLDSVMLDRDPGLSPSPDATVPPGIDQIRITHYTPERVEILVTAASPGVLVLRDSWYPGWRAHLDGEGAPLLRADGLFRAVVVPAGTHSIVFEFRPERLRTGAAVALIVLATLVAATLLTLPRPRAV